MMRLTWLGRILLAASLLCSLPLQADDSLLQTTSGPLIGNQLDGIDRYLGVPYAAPPVGGLRWRAPQAPEKWRAPQLAQHAASPCLQIGSFYATDNPEVFDKPYGSEDCLYLNIWVPQNVERDMPVLVFFHGGSGIVGDSAHPIYDGARLAQSTRAVIVTANYRLGAWGGLHHPALHTGNAAEDSGNFFLLDMIQVLRWLKDNCPNIGCAGDNITISGQSAGAVNVMALLRSPMAADLFQRAIAFSGMPFSNSVEKAQARGTEMLIQIAIAAGKANDETSAQQWLDEQSPKSIQTFLTGLPNSVLFQAGAARYSPPRAADSTVLMALEKADKATATTSNRVPLLLGSTRDEMSTLIPVKSIGRNAGKMWPLVNGAPRSESLDDLQGFWSALSRNGKIGIANWYVQRKLKKLYSAWAEQLPAVYAYRFDWDNYPQPWRDDLGAFHALDLPFIFGNFISDRPMYMGFAWTTDNRQEREALHQHISARIRAFIHAGDPNPTDAEMPVWNSWESSDDMEIWDQ